MRGSPQKPQSPLLGALLAALIGGSGLAVAEPTTALPPPAPAASPLTASGPGAPMLATVKASPMEELFARKCASCHTVGKGKRVGPDLKDAHKRRSADWLAKFIEAPSTMLDTDPVARQLVAESNGVRMPDLGLSPADAKALAALLARCSTEPCQLAGSFTPITTATAADVKNGRRYFTGEIPFKNGAAPCASCHTARGAHGPAAGGLVAKDLTNVFGRLGDEGLDKALASPAFPLMNKVFADHPLDPREVFALRAFLSRTNAAAVPPEEKVVSVPLLSVLGTFGVLIALNAAWGRRLKGVRRPMTARARGNHR